MAIKSNRYYGYVLRNPSTSTQSWVFSELPMSLPVVIKSTQTSPIPSEGTMVIGDLPDSSYGIYKYEVSGVFSSEAAGTFEVDLVKDQEVIGKGFVVTTAVGTEFLGQLIIQAVSKSCCCDSVISIVNRGEEAITPVLVNNSSLQVVITKVM